jgi:hypothetical protein
MALLLLRRPNPARPNHEVRTVLERGQQALTSASDASVGSSPTPTPGVGETSWIAIDPTNPHKLLYYGAVDDGSHRIHIPVSTIAIPDPANPRRILYPLLESLL